MTRNSQEPRRRFRFLGLAAVMLFFALLAYLLMDSMEYVDTSQILTAFYTVLALFLAIFVAGALLMLLCFSNPRLGDAAAKRFQYLKDVWAVPMKHLGLLGFRPESASDEKNQASRRMQMRRERRRYMRQVKVKDDKDNEDKTS